MCLCLSNLTNFSFEGVADKVSSISSMDFCLSAIAVSVSLSCLFSALSATLSNSLFSTLELSSLTASTNIGTILVYCTHLKPYFLYLPILVVFPLSPANKSCFCTFGNYHFLKLISSPLKINTS